MKSSLFLYSSDSSVISRLISLISWYWLSSALSSTHLSFFFIFCTSAARDALIVLLLHIIRNFHFLQLLFYINRFSLSRALFSAEEIVQSVILKLLSAYDLFSFFWVKYRIYHVSRFFCRYVSAVSVLFLLLASSCPCV